MNIKVVICMIAAIILGTLVVFAAASLGLLFYQLNVTSDAQMNREIAEEAVGCAGLMYLMLVIMLRFMPHRTMSFWPDKILFVGMPAGIGYLLWTYSIDFLELLFLLILTASLASYQYLAINHGHLLGKD